MVSRRNFQTWLTLATGWLFARRRTVTRLIVAAGAVEEKHFSSFHRFFSRAAWSRDGLGLAIFALLRPIRQHTAMLNNWLHHVHEANVPFARVVVVHQAEQLSHSHAHYAAV